MKGKRRTKENIGLLLDREGLLTDNDIGKAETFNAFFASVLPSMLMMGFGTQCALSWRTRTVGTINSQPTLNMCGICCSTWIPTSPWVWMGFIPGC